MSFHYEDSSGSKVRRRTAKQSYWIIGSRGWWARTTQAFNDGWQKQIRCHLLGQGNSLPRKGLNES